MSAITRVQLTAYLDDALTRPRIECGDARLLLKKSTQKFGLLVIDAFGSDAIPTHLLTREALAVYRRHLQPSGVLLFHISNQFVNLQPPLARLAIAENLEASEC